MKGGLKKSILVEIMSWNVMDEVILQSPEGVSAVGHPETRSSCHPSLKMYVLALMKVIESYNEKSGIYFFYNEGYTYK